MLSRDLPPVPDSLPLIVFATAHAPLRVQALRAIKADAIMVSFEAIKANPERFHAQIEPLLDWPVRLYLDSGLYTMMRKFGVSRATVHRAKKGLETPRDAYLHLAKQYASYLDKHGDFWHHVIELDVDQILGAKYTQATRRVLEGIVGKKLMPVWHVSSGMDEWMSMAQDFPYIAIGGDLGPAGEGGAAMHMMYRHMVREAHDVGTLVHGLGDTKENTFREIQWDTADSSTWISTMRFGRVGNLKYSTQESKSTGRRDRTFFRLLTDFFLANGLNPEAVAATGSNIDKLIAGALYIQYRQHLLQRRHAYARK